MWFLAVLGWDIGQVLWYRCWLAGHTTQPLSYHQLRLKLSPLALRVVHAGGQTVNPSALLHFLPTSSRSMSSTAVAKLHNAHAQQNRLICIKKKFILINVSAVYTVQFYGTQIRESNFLGKIWDATLLLRQLTHMNLSWSQQCNSFDNNVFERTIH